MRTYDLYKDLRLSSYPYELVYKGDNLYNAFLQCRRSTFWKEATQKFGINLVPELRALQLELERHKYKPHSPHEFELNERGKIRHIVSSHIRDKVVEISLTNNILIPALYPYLIYDNGASIKYKGVDFSRKRLEVHLKRYCKEYGSKGYVLLLDMKKFFDNIPHYKLLELIEPIINNKETLDFIELILNSSSVDVSYMTDEEYFNCMNVPFDSLKYFETIPKQLQTGEKIMHKSLSIGSPVSQIFGVFYLYRLDNYIKIVRSCKNYGRYMDDAYNIHHDKYFLEDVLYHSRDIIHNELGMFLNDKKTCIKTLDNFTFLHRDYSVSNGNIKVTTPRSTFLREERNLRKWHKLYLEGRIDPLDIIEAYLSWRGTIVGNKKRLEKTDSLIMRIYNSM